MLKEYELAKATFHMTDADMRDFANHRQEYFEGIKREDEFAAAIALRALVKLEQGDIPKAKSALEKTIATYYGRHRHDGNSNLLSNITAFVSTNTALSNAIYLK